MFISDKIKASKVSGVLLKRADPHPSTVWGGWWEDKIQSSRRIHWSRPCPESKREHRRGCWLSSTPPTAPPQQFWSLIASSIWGGGGGGLLEIQVVMSYLVWIAFHVIVAYPGTAVGGKRNFLIFDPTRSGAADEVTDLATQKNKLSKVAHFFANVYGKTPP